MNSSISDSDIDRLIDAFAASVGFELDEFQVEAMRKLERNAGVLVSAPTSSGKTLVAEYAIWRCLEGPTLPGEPRRRVIYTTPLKALSNQKYRDMIGRYGAAAVGLVTGEHTVNDLAPIVVMTTEILRNVIYEEPARLDDVSIVVLDEIHYIDDYPRGTVWEEVIIEAPRHIRLLGLSATISNLDEVAAWMSELRGPMATVLRTERPVPIEMWLAVDNHFHPLFDPSGNVNRKTLDLAITRDAHQAQFRFSRRAADNDLLAVVEELRRRAMLPAIYFIFSRKGCREAVSRCALHAVDLTDQTEKELIGQFHAERLAALEDADERGVFREAVDLHSLRRGIAMHHAGMLPYAKETVEQLFQRGLVKVVFATETLSLGLNMPARACVVNSFTKFDGVNFASLTSTELTQLMGRAGRRGIDTLGHGILLKEPDVEIHAIYEAALGGDMPVISKFAPTYSMTLTLLRSRSVPEVETLIQRSFGQYQATHGLEGWDEQRAGLETRLADLRQRTFRHPSVRCTERTLSQFLHAELATHDLHDEVRRIKRERWQAARRGSHRGGRLSDPGQRLERVQRELRAAHNRVNDSPCRHCPYLADHRAQRLEITDLETTLKTGRAELEDVRGRFLRLFHALRAVLTEAGYLDNDRPSDLGALAGSLYGESALVVAEAVASGILDGLDAAELASALVMLVAEDRGRGRDVPATNRDRFPTPRVERCGRALRSIRNRLRDIEASHGLDTLRPLSFDFIRAAYLWASGTPLTDIEPPPGGELGDVVKAMKNLYSMLRQMEQALREHRLRPRVVEARTAVERDLIRRI